MADRWAWLVAVDSPLHPTLGGAPYAEAGARLVSDALAEAGYAKENRFHQFGPNATAAAIESRLRRLKREMRKGDELLVWLALRGFSRGGKGVLAAWDTLPDDLTDTAVSVAQLVQELAASKAAQVTLLLDTGIGELPPDARPLHLLPHLDAEELHRLFDDSPKLLALAASDVDQESHAAAALKGSAWAWLVAEALAARGPKALTVEGTVTGLSLLKYAEEELPRVLRKHFDGRPEQTPRVYGEQNAAAVIADLSALTAARTGGGLLDSARLKRLVFRSETSGKVKDLSGFRKTYSMPDSASPSSRKFIAKCATEDVRADLNDLLDRVRTAFEYKRKDIDTSAGSDGTGYLRGPDFEYTVGVTLDADDPARVTWRREVGQLADAGFVRSAEFAAVFGERFDQLVFEFARPVDVPALIDRLEDDPPAGARLTVDGGGSSFDLTLAGFVGRIRVERTALTVRGRAGRSAGLLDQFLAFVRTVGPLGEPPALPAAG